MLVVQAAAVKEGTSLTNNPAFKDSVPGSEGKSLSLDSLIGKQALVAFFYPKAGTSGCTVEAAQFREHQNQFEEFGAQIVGISGDSPKDLDIFQKAQRLTYPLLADESGDLRKAFGIEPMTRVTFVLDKAGKVIMSYQGPKGSDPKEHIKKSLEALKSQSGSSSGEGMANDASKAGQNAPTAGSMESLKNLPDEANDSYTGAETLK
ncbi:hypothetical protein WJX79_001999 [Trebouxia sp. C0005]